MTCETNNCPTLCQGPFDDVQVLPLTEGGTKVQWSLQANFLDPEPFEFQLQVSESGVPDAEDWCNVGDPLTDTYIATDPVKRDYGVTRRAHYRVVMTTSVGTYYSPPADSLGRLGFTDRRYWDQVIRGEKLRMQFLAGCEGYLLKRKHVGTACPRCYHKLTNGPSDEKCTICYGTGLEGGYYSPAGCTYLELFNGQQLFNAIQLSRGTQEGGDAAGRLLNIPHVFSNDVWVQRDTDIRFRIVGYSTAVEIRGKPLVLQPVVLKRLPATDIVYQFPIPNQQDV